MYRRRHALLERWVIFWQQCPLLFWGLHLCLLANVLIAPSLLNITLLATVWLSKKIRSKDLKKGCIFSLLFSLSLFFFHIDRYHLHDQEKEIRGKGTFVPSHYIERKTLVKEQTLIKGTIPCFVSEDGEKYTHLFAYAEIKKNKQFPLDRVSSFTGVLKIRDGKVTIKQETISPKAKKVFLAKWRLSSKRAFNRYLAKILSKETSDLFYTIFTGEIKHASLHAIFSKTGQKQLLVVSGLHFALIGSVLQFLLSFLFPLRVNLIVSYLFLTLYFVLLGYTPSVCRAYLCFTLSMISTLHGRYLHPMQNLGSAMLLQCLLDPLSPLDLGFQLSYLATSALILLFPLFTALTKSDSKIKQVLLLQASVLIATAYPLLDQIGFIPLAGIYLSLYFPLAVTFMLGYFLIAAPFALFFPEAGKLIMIPLDLTSQFHLAMLRHIGTLESRLLTMEEVYQPILLLLLLICFGYATQNKKIFKYNRLNLD